MVLDQILASLHIGKDSLKAVAKLTLRAAFAWFSGFGLISLGSNIIGIKLLEKILCTFQTKPKNLIS